MVRRLPPPSCPHNGTMLRARKPNALAHAHFAQIPKFGPLAPGAASALENHSSRRAADLEAHGWQAKFDMAKRCPDIKTILRGEITRVADLAPKVPTETMRRRLDADDVGMTKMGPAPALGLLENAVLKWLEVYNSLGVKFCVGVVAEEAKQRKPPFARRGIAPFSPLGRPSTTPTWLAASRGRVHRRSLLCPTLRWAS